MFHHVEYPASLLNVTRFLPLVFDSNGRGRARMPNGLSGPTAFEAHLYFHALLLMSREIELRKLKDTRPAVYGELAGMLPSLYRRLVIR